MEVKPIGKCPFCGGKVQAVVTDENSCRRDNCKCPACSKQILICRTPGCTNYAKGGELWDDEFCPECTSEVVDVLKKLGTVAASTALAILTKGKMKGFK
jgi:hypothetical protein